MTINKNQIYDLIKQLSKNECYIGLHGIADNSDIKNDFSHLSKAEKAQKILELGLKNARGQTISHTVRNFGILENITASDAENINNYSFYSPSGEETIVVVAIPIFFEDSKGRKIFGGYKEEKKVSIDSAECITDYIFKDNIPSEMILGSYKYSADNQTVEFIENPKYYSHLSQSEKDDFINKYFSKFNVFDINDTEQIEKIIEFAKDWDNMPYLQKTIAQYERGLEMEKNESHTEIVDYEKELCQRLDKVLDACQHIDDVRADALELIRKTVNNNENYLEWLHYKKKDILEEQREFKDLPYILNDTKMPFYGQISTNEFSYGGADDALNSMIALPIYTMPQINGNLEENFRLKKKKKMLLGNNSCIIIEKSISNSELEKIKQTILEKIHNQEMNLGRKLTEKEKNNIISNVASLYDIENVTSFDLNSGLLVSDWENYSKENNIPNTNSNGSSAWKLASVKIIDNRARVNGHNYSLEGQLEATRLNKIDITELNYKKEEKNIEAELLKEIDENYEYRSILSKLGYKEMRDHNGEALIDLNELKKMIANGRTSEVALLLLKENKYLRDFIKNITKKDEKELELANMPNQEINVEEKSYSMDELDSTKLTNLDLSLVKPNYDIIFHSQTSNDLGITAIALYRVGKEFGIYVPMDKEAYNSLSKELKKQGMTIEQIDELCQKYYKEHKDEIDEMFLKELELTAFSDSMTDDYTK